MKFGFRWLLLLPVVLATLEAPSFAELPPGFPSTGLEDRISFWEKIFTTYGADDYVIHDNFRVNLVYEVATERTERARIRAVRSTLDEVGRKISAPETMGREARRIYNLIAETDVKLTAGNIAVLRQRVHAQRGIKERFRDGVIRSGRYLRYFEEVFENVGVPTVITLLPLVESSFENRAYSSAGAAGIWQFTRSTARAYMRVVRGRDDRLNPAIAARSAARLLKGNYEALKSWPLAISAYNHGRAGMLRAKRQHGSHLPTIIRNYKSRIYGYASKNFYAEFVAAVNVYQNYEEYFGKLALDQPLDFSSAPTQVARRTTVDPGNGVRYRVQSGDTLSEISDRYGTTSANIMNINGLLTDVIFAGETLVVTRSGSALVVANTADEYLVRWGDTLGQIARRFGMGLRELMDLNGMRNSQIFAGQLLVIR
jgi:membrane-bound lytic murein transglycosylase D